jgi:hypothetical protein
MKFLQSQLKKLPEWVVFLYLFLSLSVGPLVVFNTKWKQLGSLREAAVACGPFFFALGAIGAIVGFLYYTDELE